MAAAEGGAAWRMRRLARRVAIWGLLAGPAAACGDSDALGGGPRDAAAVADAGDAAIEGRRDGGRASDAGPAAACATLDCEPPARCQAGAGEEPACRCPAGYDDVASDASRCEDVDECKTGAHDCDADPAAACTNTEGGFECDCPVGYVGDGRGAQGCVDRDECDDATLNDCLSEERCTNLPGSYRCGCDLVGTYAAMVALEVETDPVVVNTVVVASASEATLKTFELRRVVAQDDGSITVEVTPCGGTSAELCSPLYDEAWSQDFPRGLWGKLATASGTIALSGARVGDPFITDDAAVFLGVSLPASYAAPPWPWPDEHDDPELSWLDPDQDGAPGATSIARHSFRNDLWLGDARFVQGDFDHVPASSPVCSRPYGYWVHPDGATRVREFHTGSRSVSRFVGEISSCEVIEGELRGPGPNNTPTADARIGGCVLQNGNPCSADQVAAYDAVPNPNKVNAGCFQQVRVPDSFTCADVLAYGFTLLVGPNADRCP